MVHRHFPSPDSHRLDYQHYGLRGEAREYSGDEPVSFAPVFSVGATYHPTAAMTVSLDAYRREANSEYVTTANYITTGFSLTVQQVLLGRFLASVGGGFFNQEYHTTSSNFTYSRQDDQFYLKPGFDWLINRNLRAGIYYQYRSNHSTETFYEYGNNQVGLQALWFF